VLVHHWSYQQLPLERLKPPVGELMALQTDMVSITKAQLALPLCSVVYVMNTGLQKFRCVTKVIYCRWDADHRCLQQINPALVSIMVLLGPEWWTNTASVCNLNGNCLFETQAVKRLCFCFSATRGSPTTLWSIETSWWLIASDPKAELKTTSSIQRIN